MLRDPNDKKKPFADDVAGEDIDYKELDDLFTDDMLDEDGNPTSNSDWDDDLQILRESGYSASKK